MPLAKSLPFLLRNKSTSATGIHEQQQAQQQAQLADSQPAPSRTATGSTLNVAISHFWSPSARPVAKKDRGAALLCSGETTKTVE